MIGLFARARAEDLLRRRFRGDVDGLGGSDGNGAVLIGAGGVGRFFLGFLRAAGGEPAFFIDNNPRLWGARIEGVEVRSPEALAAEPWRRAILCAASGLQELRRQAASLGCSRIASYFDFTLPPFPFVAASDAEIDSMIAGEQPARACAMLADEESREVFRGTAAFHITHDVADLPPHRRGEYFLPEFFEKKDFAHFVDGGAFDGDTLAEFLAFTGGDFVSYHAIEPDRSNRERLATRVAGFPDDIRRKIHVHDCALGEAAGTMRFQGLGNACSTLRPDGCAEVRLSRLDSLLEHAQGPTFVKLDIEGGEPGAMRGMEPLLRRWRPALAICVYHEVDHLWTLPLWIDGLGLGYRIHLRKHSETYSETVCYAVPSSPDREAS